jgi:uncharacterized membrane protein (DUF106 family)
MEVRVSALQQQLKQRKVELDKLKKERNKTQRERLRAKEQSLINQIQVIIKRKIIRLINLFSIYSFIAKINIFKLIFGVFDSGVSKGSATYLKHKYNFRYPNVGDFTHGLMANSGLPCFRACK